MFLERREGRERERKREKHQCAREIPISCPLAIPHLETWLTTQPCSLTGNRTSDFSICRTMPSPLSHTSQSCELKFSLKVSYQIRMNGLLRAVKLHTARQGEVIAPRGPVGCSDNFFSSHHPPALCIAGLGCG